MSDEIQIEKLRSNLKRLQDDFSEAHRLAHRLSVEVRSAAEAIDLRVWGIQRGSLVEGTSGNQVGVIYRVYSVSPRMWGENRRPWVVGQRRKNDGNFENRQVNLFDDWKMHEETPGQDNHKEALEAPEAPVDPTGDQS